MTSTSWHRQVNVFLCRQPRQPKCAANVEEYHIFMLAYFLGLLMHCSAPAACTCFNITPYVPRHSLGVRPVFPAGRSRPKSPRMLLA